MENPKKQIPQAIIIGGLVIAAIYIFTAFGIGVAVPVEEINTSAGMIESFQVLTGQTGGPFIALVSVLFLLTLFGNMISWSMGVNSVARYAANKGDMPSVFRKEKNGIPTGSAVMNGIVASIVVCIAPFIGNEDLFWSFFALNLVMFLLAYVPIFPDFLRLRKIDPKTPRPFHVSGKASFLKILATVPAIIIVISLIFIAVPLSFDAETLEATLPITVGAIIFILMEEVMLWKKPKKEH